MRVEFYKKASLKVVSLLVVLAIIIGLGYIFQREPTIIKPAYSQVYRLVNEKISQGAPVVFYLPQGIDKESAKQGIKFSPEIKGNWQIIQDEDKLLFKPEKDLTLNNYYSVELTTPTGELLRTDFQAVKNPEIVAIFPHEGSETPENSEITIVFNRPMVPLTTIDYQSQMDIPVEITPVTKGRFKWITTSILQFIPEERLIRSSRYQIIVKPGLISMDGLPVEGKSIEFTTRKLRYVGNNTGKMIYNQPFIIYFNQEVDLGKIKKEITLTDTNTKKELPFIAEYGKKSAEGIEEPIDGSPWQEVTDESVIYVYNQRDSFGRARFWDFEKSYFINLKQAHPAEGDLILDQPLWSLLEITGPLENLSAQSHRTDHASPDFFDPQGKLEISFYEEVDISRSKIIAPALKEIVYGEKPEDDSQYNETRMVTDKKKILLSFESSKIGRGEKLEIILNKIVNLEGLTINREPIKKVITSYPELKILKTSPANTTSGADITNLGLTTTTPLRLPSPEEYKNYIKSNFPYELYIWGRPFRVYDKVYQERGLTANPGDFVTWINWGIMPNLDYSLELNLEDVFGQKAKVNLAFISGKMPGMHLRFQHLQNPYNVTTPDNTKLNYATVNMEYVNLEIYKFEALAFLKELDKRPYEDELPEIISGFKEKITSRINLPKRYWLKNYFQIDIKDYFKDPLGHYLVVFSHPQYTYTYYDWKKQQSINQPASERTYLTVTNLGVAEKKIDPETVDEIWITPLSPEKLKTLYNLYWVTGLKDLSPVSEAKINLYEQREGKLIPTFTSTTNSEGIAFTELIPNLKGVVISKGNDSTIILSRESQLWWAGTAYTAPRIYLYTDKPIYQPGQEVFIKGLYRTGYDGQYEIPQGKKAGLKIYNSRGDVVLEQTLNLNDYGTFNTRFLLDRSSPLGSYWMSVDQSGYGSFDVQEYIPAPFEVTVKEEKTEYISKDTVNLEVNARYYFGVPLEGGEVTYTITTQNYYFDRYPEGNFSFGSGGYFWYPYEQTDRFYMRGSIKLDVNGRAAISQILDLEKMFKEEKDRTSKIIVLDITVQNTQGQSVSTQKSYILHAGEFYLGISTDKYDLGKEEKFNLQVKSLNTGEKQGWSPIKVENINFNLYQVEWVYSKRQGVGGGFQYQWERKRTVVDTFTLSTDSKGDYRREYQIFKEGEYELEISASDKRGNRVFANRSLYVYGKGEVSIKPSTDTKLELETENTQLKAGEEGRVIIKSPYTEAKALITIERGRIFDYQIKKIEGNLSVFSFPVKEDYLPNVFVSVLLISSKPEMKFGQIEFQVNTDRKRLEIQVESNKKDYLPGEEVTLDIQTREYAYARDQVGKPVPAEVSLSVADLSVLALKGNPKKNPLSFFYSGFPLCVSTASNVQNILVRVEIPTKGGGALKSEEDLTRKKRGVFKETAFWQAVVRTDDKGKAKVKFTLPDNLTTWQTETLGITLDTRLGIHYLEFITRKELMLVPLKPRFVVPGDIFQIGAQIFKPSLENLKVKVKLESPTLTLLDEQLEREIILEADKSQTVYFKVQAPPSLEKGEHVFTFSVKGGNLEDTVEQRLSITPDNTYEVTATSNYLTQPIFKEYLFLPDNISRDKGSLAIKASATLAVFLSDALQYLLEFPYGCSEQIASKLSAIATVKKGLNVPHLEEKLKLQNIRYEGREYSLEEAVQIGLTELANSQNFDGGFTFWRGSESGFYLTLQVVDALLRVKEAGFPVNETVLNRAVDYLKIKITNEYQYYSNKETVILTVATLIGFPEVAEIEDLKKKVVSFTRDEAYLQENISSVTLTKLALIMVRGGYEENLKEKVFNILDNRVKIDGRGAFLGTGKIAFYDYYETPIKNTALYLKAQVADKRDNPLLDKVLRWLLNSRYKDGSWGSTQNTLVAIDALTDFLVWKRETESDFTLEVSLNELKEGEYRFQKETILNQFKKEIPPGKMKFNQINEITFRKTNHNTLPNAFYYDMALKYYLPVEQIPPRDEGLGITREFYQPSDKKREKPLTRAKVGEVIRVKLQITVPEYRTFVMLEDFIPAGMEIVNLDLSTEDRSLMQEEGFRRDINYWQTYFDRFLYPQYKAIYNDRVFLYLGSMSPGVYEFEYFARALIRGKFIQIPAIVSEMYFPEIFGRTAGRYFEIE